MTGDLEEHEAYLRAVFDHPADDAPRLAYADFLEDHDAPERAELIRVQCELEGGRETPPERRAWLCEREGELIPRVVPERGASVGRGFWWRMRAVVGDPPADNVWSEPVRGVELSADDLAEPRGLRQRVVDAIPTWFAETRLAILPARRLGPGHVETLFALPFLQQVTEWDLGGRVEEVTADPQTEDAGTFALIDLNVSPVITPDGVEALANHRGARRLRTLILTHNNLGNDAARSLARSKYLINLEHLVFREGNNLRGRVWQELVERYGENVVG